MATSTVARWMVRVPLCAIFLIALASAQSVSPSNATLPDDEKNSLLQLKLSGGHNNNLLTFDIAPLTVAVGRGQNSVTVGAMHITGNLELADQSNPKITGGDIVYITCDVSTSNIDTSTLVGMVGSQNPRPEAIVLYSLTSQNCNLNGSYPDFQSLFTMTSLDDSKKLYVTANSESQSTATFNAVIGINGTTNGQGSSGTSTNNDGVGGPAPTTAVAMSILYSITGIITLLFLIIIATGAIRAHRHPERYGPRAGHTGRPRQSRAKGLARAMLETLPIVKFGDPEPVKPENRDIELENGNTLTHPPPEITTVPESTPAIPQSKAIPATTKIESGMGPNTQEASVKSGEETAADGELGCSICTEDFTTGDDVRVLPCKHKYHPACIDPWLLNVSGTCPLCRHDLRPEATADSQGTPGVEGDELPPPLPTNETSEVTNLAATATTQVEGGEAHQRRVSRFLHLRTATPEQRIATARHLHQQSLTQGAAVQDIEESGGRARLTGRLRDTFRIRTRRQEDGNRE